MNGIGILKRSKPHSELKRGFTIRNLT